MKRMLSTVMLLTTWATAPSLFAQEPVENELEFVRQLRAKGKSWNGLVKAKIEELLKRNDPFLNAALPLELARTNIEAARQLDPDQRFVLFIAARSQLEDYIKKNRGKVGAALASVELARLTSYHAQALLSKAMREEDNQKRHDKAQPAEKMFVQAGKDLESAVKLLEAAVKDPANSAMKKALDRDLQQARFDTAINYFDQARTYIDRGKDAVNAARTNTIEEARKRFLALASEDSAEVSYLANAWAMKCAMEQTAPDDALKYYTYVMKKKEDPAATPAVRLVRYFHIQDITLPRRDDVETVGGNMLKAPLKKGEKKPAPVTPAEQLHKVQKECEAWIKDYGIRKSYEGEGVLFELAYSYLVEASMLDQALKNEKEKKVAAKDDKAKSALFKKAEEKFDELAKLDGDNAERARQLSASIKIMTLPATGKLSGFNDYLMRAMLEREKVRELSNKLEDAKNPEAAKKIEDERKKKLRDVITALNEGLNLATLSDPPSKLDDARYYLCGAYMAYGDPYRAAIIGEALGRNRPATKRSAEGASTAIATYASLQSRRPDDTALRDRLKDLATFVLSPENKAWSADPVTSLAHYHLAMIDKKDNKLKSAVQHLEQIAPGFTDYIYTQGQLAFIAEDAALSTEDPKEKAWYRTAAKSAINRLPKFNLKDDSPSVITMYFFAKIEMSKFLYAEAFEEMNAADGKLKAVATCKKMTKYLQDLQAEFATVSPGKISGKTHDQLQFTLQVMLKYADLGIAEVKFRTGENEEVLKATSAVVTEMLAEAKKTPTGDLVKKDNAVIGKILGLALRANVQKGDVGKGKAILDVLQRLKGEAGNDSGPGNVVSELLRDIAGQIKIMVDNKDANLAKTKDNYIGFLDVIAKETKEFDRNNATMLAHAYMSLQVPAKAAAIFAKVQPPAGLDKKIVIPKNETPEQKEARAKVEEDFARYWATQIEYIRALRGIKDKESMKTAESLINDMLNPQKHPNARFQIQAMMEKNHLLEDQQKYREAWSGWNGIMKNPSIAGRLNDKDVQKIYFTSYFHTARTLYKVAILDPGIKDRPKLVTAAANMMVKLEYTKGQEGWQIVYPLFQEFLKEKEADQFKKEYERLKAVQQKSAALARVHQQIAAVREPIITVDEFRLAS